MDLYEFQAMELLGRHGVPVVEGRVVASGEEAEVAAERLGCPVVVKAQVKVGGRGKAGGVRVVSSPVEAGRVASEVLGMDIRGYRVGRVLVVPASEIVREFYVSFLVDRGQRSLVGMVSVAGGMDIEEVAVSRPEALVRVAVDPLTGLGEVRAREMVESAGFPESVVGAVAGVLVRLWECFVAEDATLVEVNPLVLDGRGEIVALDGKVTLDGNAAFRHPDHAAFADSGAEDPLEAAAAAKGLNYVKLDGQVGVIGNGAGLVMSTLDVVAFAGERFGVGPANFLDIGGGASAQVMADGLGIVLSDPQVRSVLVNVFGGITACDQVATGIVHALDLLGEAADKPLVVRLDGNNAATGREILTAAGHPLVTAVDTMDAAAQKAAELAAATPAGATGRGA